ncbi:MAG TPA: amidohydrolase family protein [bacterium]|nr:amidohydrolase family protein [bacterium]
MARVLPETQPAERRKTSPLVIDADVHHTVSLTDLMQYLSDYWRHFIESTRTTGIPSNPYPKTGNAGVRSDSFPPGGGRPGSDPDFTRKQLLDEWNVAYAILNSNFQMVALLPHIDFAVALARATNEWTQEHWLERDPRFKASIVIPAQDAEESAKEIDRTVASHPGFIQVLLPSSSDKPYGHRRYHKIYEAAARHNLPIGIHLGGATASTPPPSPNGWFSYYIEFHAVGGALSMITHMASLVCEGVFKKFPTLKVVMMEGGFGWVPSIMWRLDKDWRGMRHEVPWVDRRPSEYIREHFHFTTQPIEEPEDPRHLQQIIDMIGSESFFLFATDYPHWDFDAPDRALQAIRKDLRPKIFYDNAKQVYRL